MHRTGLCLNLGLKRARPGRAIASPNIPTLKSHRVSALSGFQVSAVSAIGASVGNARVFKTGRQMAARLGLVPRQYSSGGEVLGAPFIQMDETYLQVVRSEKASGSDHYMVVRAGGALGRRVVLFNYLPSRTGETLKGLLMGRAVPIAESS